MNSPNSTINVLPIEIISKIFDFLDHKSMLNASLVCKTWNEVISSSEIFLNSTKLVMLVTADSKTCLTRKYRSILMKLVDQTLLGRRFLNQMKNICKILTKIVIQGPSSISSKDFITFFKMCTNLQHLEINNVSQNGSTSANLSVGFPKLEFIHLDACNWILKFIEVNTLKTLVFEACNYDPNDDEQSAMVKFFNKLEKLDRIVMINSSLKSVSEILVPKFTWSHLKFRNIESSFFSHQQNESWIRNVQNLIDAAGHDAKVSLEGSSCGSTCVRALLRMIRHQKKITSMKVELRAFTRYQEATNLNRLDNIKRLKLRQYHSGDDTDRDLTDGFKYFDQIKLYFPNVETLDIDWNAALFICSFNTNEVQFIFHKLKYLKVDDLIKCIQLCRFIVFPAIETLEVTDAFMFAGREFGANNPTLRKLIVHYRRHGVAANTWRMNLECFPSVQDFELFDHTVGEHTVMTRGEVEYMLQKNA